MKDAEGLVCRRQEPMTAAALPCGLYFIADRSALPGDAIYRVTEAALKGGVSLVQYRAKDLPPQEATAPAARLLELTAAHGVPLLVNDLPELAAAIGAQGVHLGQGDAPIPEARRLLGAAALIGATTPTPQAARAAELQGASYLSVGPVFSSPTKPEKPCVGVERLRAVRAAVRAPLCAIGGITAENVGELAECGVQLVAVISAIAASADPSRAAAALVEAMQRAGIPA